MRRASGVGLVLRPPHIRLLLLLAVLPLVDGCARTGDFGRGGTPVALPTADPSVTGSVPGSSFPLSDDERQLRDLARGLLTSPNEQSRSLLNMTGAATNADNADRYVQYLVSGPFRSAAARYSRLVDDTRNDITRLEPFFMAARRVADLDMKRERSLPHVSRLTQDELLNAKRRVRENMMLIAEVHRIMMNRVVMFRTALERLVIALPSPLAVEAERQRLELERRLAEIRVFASAPQPVAGGFSGPHPIVSK
jgi:hypothetical protein